MQIKGQSAKSDWARMCAPCYEQWLDAGEPLNDSGASHACVAIAVCVILSLCAQIGTNQQIGTPLASLASMRWMRWTVSHPVHLLLRIELCRAVHWLCGCCWLVLVDSESLCLRS